MTHARNYVEGDPSAKPDHMDPNEPHAAAKTGNGFRDSVRRPAFPFFGFFQLADQFDVSFGEILNRGSRGRRR